MLEQVSKLQSLLAKEEYKNLEMPKEVGEAIIDLVNAVCNHIIEDIQREKSDTKAVLLSNYNPEKVTIH